MPRRPTSSNRCQQCGHRVTSGALVSEVQTHVACPSTACPAQSVWHVTCIKTQCALGPCVASCGGCGTRMRFSPRAAAPGMMAQLCAPFWMQWPAWTVHKNRLAQMGIRVLLASVIVAAGFFAATLLYTARPYSAMADSPAVLTVDWATITRLGEEWTANFDEMIALATDDNHDVTRISLLAGLYIFGWVLVSIAVYCVQCVRDVWRFARETRAKRPSAADKLPFTIEML